MTNKCVATYFAVSGSGKTRLTLEGLCHQWGFYISCRGASKNWAAGSDDFLVATTMEEMSSWDKCNEGPDDPVNVARRAFEMLICAWLFVFKHLLTKLSLTQMGRQPDGGGSLFKPCRPPFDIPVTSSPLSLQVSVVQRAGTWATLPSPCYRRYDEDIRRNDFPPKPAALRCDRRSLSSCRVYERIFLFQDHRTNPFYRFLWDSDLFKGIILAGTGLSMRMVRNVVFSRSAQLLDESRKAEIP